VLASLAAQDGRTDKVTVLRQWLYHGAEHYAVQMASDGRISLSRAAKVLDVSMFDLFRVAESYKIELGATAEQSRAAWDLVAKLGRSQTESI
jgi:hypothetical protein